MPYNQKHLLSFFLGLFVFYTNLYVSPLAATHSDESMVCIGSWNIPQKVKNFPLIFQGEIIENEEGMFCFNIPMHQTALGMLFIDIKYVRFEMKGNTVTGIKIADETPEYKFFIFYKSLCNSDPLKPFLKRFTWKIEQQELPVISLPGKKPFHEIPLFTIIVPLSPSFFEHDSQKNMIFSQESWDLTKQFMKLPAPSFTKNNETKLQKAVEASFLAIPDLRPINTTQEKIVRKAGPITVSYVK
jgi:hypothetical protein